MLHHKKTPPSGGAFFVHLQWKVELTAVVNEAPVALQSRGLSEPAGECSSPSPCNRVRSLLLC